MVFGFDQDFFYIFILVPPAAHASTVASDNRGCAAITSPTIVRPWLYPSKRRRKPPVTPFVFRYTLRLTTRLP